MRTVYRFFAGVFSLVVLSALGCALYLQNILPDSYYVTLGDKLDLSSQYSYVTCAAKKDAFPIEAYASAGNSYTLDLRFLGLIDIKQVAVQVVDRRVVSVCGTPFGIKMFTDGVMVVGMGPVPTENGNLCPARSAGLQQGDIILSLNGEKKLNNQVISGLVQKSQGAPMALRYHRGDEIRSAVVTPVLSNTDSRYHIGLWVRDSSAGIGTLTFCDPETGMFAGLGHAICDVDTGEVMPLSQGEIVHAFITGVAPGLPGEPGELKGTFRDNNTWGRVYLNNVNGIYGKFCGTIDPFTTIPMAMSHEVVSGPAKILTTVDGETPEYFDVTIEKVQSYQDSAGRNMVIHVTDPDLLEKTGGIVQGMSGSPILQDGMLVGAVTHVFVNDPTRGYGIFAENMDSSLSYAAKNAA